MPTTDPVSPTVLDRCASSATNNEEHALPEADPVEAKRVVGDLDRNPSACECHAYLAGIDVLCLQANLKAKIATLESQIEETRVSKKDIAEKLVNPDVQATVSKHIKLLHQYNEIRDVGQGLMGLIADQRGVRIGDVHEEFGVAQGD